MKHVINFSGGLGSFWAAKRVIERFGILDVILLFADVLVESPELYKFLAAASALLRVPITRISEEKTPWELFREQGAIGNSAHPICSYMLKREPLDRWMRQNTLEMDTILYVGFDWTELHRLEKLRLKRPMWRIEAPMTEAPFWDKCRMIEEAKKIGLPEQPAYEQGFPHNNCGKRCVAAGISHWVHLYHVDYTAFDEWATEEQDTLIVLEGRGIKGLTMLKDRRGGTTRNLSLVELANRIESGEQFTRQDWGGCGCGASDESAAAS